MSDADKNIEVYKQTLETWRYEVNSYWQRNSYFSALETAALGGCWVVADHHPKAGVAFSILGLLSAVVWLITGIAVHRYIKYWWKSVKYIEVVLKLSADGVDFATNHTGSGGLYPSKLTHTIPVLFGLAWVVILCYAVSGLCLCKAH